MRLEPTVTTAFLELVPALEQMDLPYAWIGGIVRNVWGTPRATTDLDVNAIVEPSDVAKLSDRLGSAGFLLERSHSDADPGDPVPNLFVFRAGLLTGVRLDLLVAKTPFERAAIGRRIRVQFLHLETWAVTAEDLIVFKLVAFRSRDRLDIEDVLRTQMARQKALDLAYVARWAEEWGVSDRWRQMQAVVKQLAGER